MAANEKQLGKVTLTLTNKMVGSQAGPLTTAHKVPIRQQKHQSNIYGYITGKHTPTCSAANLTPIQSHPGSPVSMATDFNHIIWGENCKMDARSVNRLIPSPPLDFIMHFMCIWKCIR